ncbi:MAG: LysE family translocator [Rhodobacteraceae bacterium]|nr:LysE family translocator [Paracoccaceae bacterium]
MSEHLASLGLALGIFSVGFLVIGPNILAVIGTSMARGRRDGAVLALGIGLGSGLWASLTVLGLATLMTTYAGAVTALKFAGAGYLLWMAYKAFRSAATSDADLKPKGEVGGNMFLRGLIIQMTNPKAALQWIAIVAIGIGPEAPFVLGAALVISATLLSILGHMVYALTFSTTPVIRAYAHARRWIEGALGVVFVFASYKLATARV